MNVAVRGENMSNKDLVVKDNALIHAAYRLSLAEQRLILLSIVAARSAGLKVDEKRELEVHALAYTETFKVAKQTAYEALKEAAESLMKRSFSYEYRTEKGDLRTAKSAWVQYIDYSAASGTIKLIFATKVIPLITQLEKHFTSYEMAQVSNLTSAYAIRLYELLMLWKSTLKTEVFDIEIFREKLGIEPSKYTTMSNFKARVLEPAIRQINATTDILASYQQHKTGRKITGISFSFSYKKAAQATSSKRCEETMDFVDEQNPTAKQLGYYAKLLAQSHWATQARVMQGVNSKDAIGVITAHIKQPKNLNKLMPTITKLIAAAKG